MILYYGPLWASILFVTVAMALVFRRVTANVLKADSDQTANNSSTGGSGGGDTMALMDNLRNDKKAFRRNIAIQCFLYSASFYFNWAWLTSVRILQAAKHPIPFPLLAIAAFITPMFGLPNFCVYLFPTFLSARHENPNAGVLAWIRAAL